MNDVCLGFTFHSICIYIYILYSLVFYKAMITINRYNAYMVLKYHIY